MIKRDKKKLQSPVHGATQKIISTCEHTVRENFVTLYTKILKDNYSDLWII